MILFGWASRDPAIVLPTADVQSIFHRARQFHLQAGGRFEIRRGRTIIVWPAQPSLDRARPVAAIQVRWRTPDPAHATIWRIGWDAHGGVPEDEVWRALELLHGGPLAH